MITHVPGNKTEKLQAKNFVGAKIYVLARQALYEYIGQKGIQKALLPRFCAVGAYLPFIESKVELEFYDLDEKLNIRLEKDLSSYSDFLFMYLHPFGLLKGENIDFLQKNRIKFGTVIDDRCSTLPIKKYDSFSDAELYSIYKLTNVPVGGYLLNEDNEDDFHYNEEVSLEERIFTCRDELFNSFITKFGNIWTLKLLLRLKKRSVNYSSIGKSFISKGTTVSRNTALMIKGLNIKLINELICQNNSYLFEGLDSRFYIADKASYVSQATIGFPIRIDNQREFHNYLTKNGILGFTLKNGWQIDGVEDYYNHANRHYCLPNSYSLEEKALDKIIDVVNRY